MTDKLFLKMEIWLRAINIASISPQSTKAEQTQRDIINHLSRNETHIAAIRETRIAHGREYAISNYRAATAAAAKKTQMEVYREE